MRTRSQNPFTTVTTAGLLLPVDLLSRIVEGDPDLPGFTPKDYHLRSGERLNEAASRAWNECLAAWNSFRKRFAALPASDTGTTLTRDEWLLPLFQELGYGRLQPKKAIEIEDKEYPISHGWENHVPIHLLSARYPLDRRTPGVSGAATRAPYSLMQEMLNRSARHRWGLVSNGLKLFLLRDNAALARAANVEFDLEVLMEGEHYSDFMLLYLLCHQSRVEIQVSASGGRGSGRMGTGTGEDDQEADSDDEGRAGKPEDCWLENWANLADSHGTRAREKLRNGVEAAIKSLGSGFLTTKSKANNVPREKLSTGELSTQDYYRQLLRLVYRVLMLLVAEKKKSETGENLLHPPGTPQEVRERYTRFYSVGRIRMLAYERRGTAHSDLYESLKVLFLKLREGYSPLGIPGMGSFLFSKNATPDLDDATLGNQDLLDAFRHLCYTEDTSSRGGSVRRPVDFGNLGSEELGSVYESLLELHPQIDTDDGSFTLGTAAGHERKTTGSYYTPRSLINCLLDSALDPVVGEAIDIPDPAEAEQKLLALKVCDPACGSGHFLIAAAERMAMHLARLRTGDDQPSMLDVQHAKRDIIGRCIYGVDLNPMAVELCKVSLWMEALEPGKPLSFLDHHIQCGNSLLGATPRLLAEGIPDEAFKPIEGDDKKICAELKKANKKEREEYKKGQGYLFEPYVKLVNTAAEFAKLTAAGDDSLEPLAAKEKRYAELVKGADYQNARFWADTWCAAFVWKKDDSDLGKLCPTERKFRDIEKEPRIEFPHVRKEVERLGSQYQFFHWHLAFPDVSPLLDVGERAEELKTGWKIGFDVILGNPPWDKLQPEEQKFFAVSCPQIAQAATGAKRKKMIEQLESVDEALFDRWIQYKRSIDGASHFLKMSQWLPLTTKGNLNLYRLFAELASILIARSGRAGMVLQTGLATDQTSRDFLSSLLRRNQLVQFLDFENRTKFFVDVDIRFRFALVTMGGINADQEGTCLFGWLLQSLSDLTEPNRLVILNASDLRLFNPNSETAPTFTSTRDFLLNRHVYNSGYHLRTAKARLGEIEFQGEIYNMTRDSAAFKPDASHSDQYAPLYEAKNIHQFDHRYASAANGSVEEVSVELKKVSNFCIVPRYWVAKSDAVSRVRRQGIIADWLVGFRSVSSGTNERTAIFSVFPLAGAGNSINVVLGLTPAQYIYLLANGNSFIFDYTCRQKMSGMNVNIWIMEQLPVIPEQRYERPFLLSGLLKLWILPRVLEITYSAWDLEPFAKDCGYDGPPFRWDEERRFLLRCELDAAYFHLYLGASREWGMANGEEKAGDRSDPSPLATHHSLFPTPRDAVGYIMETFPIVKRKDIAKHGEYRTKRVILEIYDRMQRAIEIGEPYETLLEPPPADPRVAHLPRVANGEK